MEAFKVVGDKLYKKAKKEELNFYAAFHIKNHQYYEENLHVIDLIPQVYGIENDTLIMVKC